MGRRHSFPAIFLLSEELVYQYIQSEQLYSLLSSTQRRVPRGYKCPSSETMYTRQRLRGTRFFTSASSVIALSVIHNLSRETMKPYTREYRVNNTLIILPDVKDGTVRALFTQFSLRTGETLLGAVILFRISLTDIGVQRRIIATPRVRSPRERLVH